jgi:uncharacterized caspase-like protein
MRGLGTLVFMIPAMLALVTGAQAEKRLALVIGNSAYQHTSELKNPRNDAVDMAAALKGLKFEVVEGFDLDKRTMEITVRKFAQALKNADVALFFYAGHGLQVNGQNYLVPIDARLEDATGLDFEMIRLDLVHRAMERETKANLIFLDACRDNPLSRNLARAMGTRSGDIGHGLAPVESGVGTLISFSTQPGNVALDGEGRNSPFASALAKRIRTEGEDLSSILISVRNDVMEATRNRQIPWEHSALRSKFFFSAPTPAGAMSKANTQAEVELAYWNAAQASGNAGAFRSYLERYPHGAYAESATLMLDKLRQEEASRVALAAREADLRKAEEERRKAENAKRAEELAAAREEVRQAQEAVRAETQRLAALRAAAEAAKASEGAKSLQQPSTPQPVQVANLPAEPKPSASSMTDVATLARSLKTELKRVGCDPGPLDSNWTTQTKKALSDFSRATKTTLSVEHPTSEALLAVTTKKVRVCARVCGPKEVLLGGNCVAKASLPKKGASESAKETSAPQGGACYARQIGSHAPFIVPCGDPASTGRRVN